ncbi:hypothetical protein GCM10009544_44540 [Streptomyces stramineus]|uniref:Tn3 transposase DDE domain-containing protein n=1 Tax=Streptomyces stramineus TaxID=173861 RepID=A0ABN1AIV1_9ACTN
MTVRLRSRAEVVETARKTGSATGSCSRPTVGTGPWASQGPAGFPLRPRRENRDGSRVGGLSQLYIRNRIVGLSNLDCLLARTPEGTPAAPRPEGRRSSKTPTQQASSRPRGNRNRTVRTARRPG